MKLLLSVLALSLIAITAEAANPVDVQLNNPAYRGLVKSYLDSRRAQYRFVKVAGDTNYLKIDIKVDLSSGASCSLSVDGMAGGAQMTSSASRSNSFIWPSNRAAFCQKAILQMMEDSMGMFDL